MSCTPQRWLSLPSRVTLQKREVYVLLRPDATCVRSKVTLMKALSPHTTASSMVYAIEKVVPAKCGTSCLVSSRLCRVPPLTW